MLCFTLNDVNYSQIPSSPISIFSKKQQYALLLGKREYYLSGGGGDEIFNLRKFHSSFNFII